MRAIVIEKPDLFRVTDISEPAIELQKNQKKQLLSRDIEYLWHKYSADIS